MHRSLINTYLYITLFSVIFISVFNYIVDPYGIHQAFIIQGFNEQKPERYANTPESKLINLLDIQANTLILGTSRSEFGVDPDIISWPIGSKPVYNMALGLSNFREMNYIIDEVFKVYIPSQLIIGIDFISFANVKNSNNLRSIVRNKTDMKLGWSLLSFGALKASFQTVLSQKEYSHVNYKYNGSRTSRSYSKSLEVESHQNLFDRMNGRYNYKSVLSLGFRSDIVESNFELLIKMLNKLSDNGVKVVLYFSPVHSELLKEIYSQDAWDSFQDIKRQLTQKINSDPLLSPIKLWDFSIVNNFTTETIPSKLGEKMEWYYDSAHYKPSLGKMVFYDMLNVKENFGKVLNNENIGAHLSSQTKRLLSYMASRE